MKSFDRKFGPEFLAALPAAPGVYRVYDARGELIYVGKAKHLRRRLAQYRNAKRRKKHAKMRSIVAEAERIEHEVCASDLEACLLETRLIQAHRPRWNVAGAFYFLYPMLGVRRELGESWFVYTTSPQKFPEYRFHGAFRSRDLTREGFFALMSLLDFFGHRIPRNRIYGKDGHGRRDRYSSVCGFRQIPEGWAEKLESFWLGESKDAFEDLILALVDNAGARRKREQVQEHLNQLKRFWKHEAMALAKARKVTGYDLYPVPQLERDHIFLKHRPNISTRARRAAKIAGPASIGSSPR
jgi:excinuclease ABC subunit C